MNRYLPSLPDLTRSLVTGVAIALAAAWVNRVITSQKDPS